MGGSCLWIMGGHRKPMKDYEYELDKSTGEVVKKYTHKQMVDKMLQNPEVLREYVRLINNGEFKKVKKDVEL
jgi:hypothetical protein